jgi:hypothetical protein
VGKWPRTLTARRSLELMDSMALVVQMILRISTSKPRNGTNSGQEFSHRRMIAGYRCSQFSENSANRSSAACSEGAV